MPQAILLFTLQRAAYICGHRQVVRHQLPKLTLAGSSPVARSRNVRPPAMGAFCWGPSPRQLRAMDKQMTRAILRKASKTHSVNPYTGRFPATVMRKARRTRRRLSRTLCFDRKRRTARQPSEPPAERPANARTTVLPRARQCENRVCSNAARRRGLFWPGCRTP